MIVAIHQPNYLPWMGLFDKIRKSDLFVFFDDVQYSHGSKAITNRNKIKTPRGWRWLTVPTRKAFPQLVGEVLIDNEGHPDWARSHLDSLRASYSESPYFKDFKGFLEGIYSETWQHLGKLNIDVIKCVMEALDIQTPLILSSSLNVSGAKSERIIEICRRVNGDTYLAGRMSTYLDKSYFEQAGIGLKFQSFRHPIYPQVYPQAGFVPNLSILDAIFCWGARNVEHYISGQLPDTSGAHNHLHMLDTLA